MRKRHIALEKQLLNIHKDPRILPRYKDNTYVIGERAVYYSVPKGLP